VQPTMYRYKAKCPSQGETKSEHGGSVPWSTTSVPYHWDDGSNLYFD
jgi:hypothetical protein